MEVTMNRSTKLSFFSAVGLASAALFVPPNAATANELVGTWKLLSLMRQEFEVGTVKEVPEANARGEIIFTPEGRYLAILTGKCTPLNANENSHGSIVVHAGRYQVTGDKLIQHVEVSGVEALMGVTQKQFIGWAGDKLILESTVKNATDGTAEITILTLERPH
jgi:Lipocalin-like domain